MNKVQTDQEIRLGNRPELRWIQLCKLYVDHKYQRNADSAASRRNLNHIRTNFSWAHCGALTVCYEPEEKMYAVIDGQHRLAAAKERGDIDSLPCVVIIGQDLAEQANTFVSVNTRRVKLTNIAAYHAAVAAGEPNATSLKELLDDCSIEIPRTVVGGGKTSPRQTQCVGTLLGMLEKYSERQISWALTIIPESYGEEIGQMRASIIKALAEFIKLNPETDREKMVRVLESLEVEKLEKDARSYVGISGGSITSAIVEALDQTYKKFGRKRGT